MGWIKRLICKHNYSKVSESMIHAGMGKMLIYKCHECGKEKGKFI